MYVASLFWIFAGGVGRKFYGGGVVGGPSMTRNSSLVTPTVPCSNQGQAVKRDHCRNSGQ